MIGVEVKLIVIKSLELSKKFYLIVNLKVNISTIAVQVKFMIGVDIKLIVVSSMELSS